jgi:hypothetical protein
MNTEITETANFTATPYNGCEAVDIAATSFGDFDDGGFTTNTDNKDTLVLNGDVAYQCGRFGAFHFMTD